MDPESKPSVQSNYDDLFKVLLIGSANVGKSELLRKYGHFNVSNFLM